MSPLKTSSGQTPLSQPLRRDSIKDGRINRPESTSTSPPRRGSRNQSYKALDKASAATTVKALFKGSECAYELIDSAHFRRRNTKLRSKSYEAYHILCHRNSSLDAGWLLCRYALSGACPIDLALEEFDTNRGGTSSLLRHTKTHQVSSGYEFAAPLRLSPREKSKVINAAVRAAAYGIFPLSFTYKKPGMILFAQAIFEAGQAVPVGRTVDIADLLPSHTALTEGLKRMASSTYDEFKRKEIPDVMIGGSGVSCDGLKQQETGFKLYDFVVHYFRLGPPDALTGNRRISFISKVLFLKGQNGPESASALHEMLNCALQGVCGVELKSFMRNFTFVTDCANTMPAIVGASTSSSRVALSDKWMGCISHQLNTAMKRTMLGQNSIKSRVAEDLSKVRTIVSVFKHGGWKRDLPPGYALIQEVETRFGTTHSVVERFLKSATKVGAIIAKKDSLAANEAFDGLLREEGEDGANIYPALEAVSSAFAPVCYVQTQAEASSSPTVHLILPMMEHLKLQLRRMSTGMAHGSNFSIPHTYTQELCTSLLNELQRIEVHPLWISSCLLHPGLRSLAFVNSTTERTALKERGCRLIQLMCQRMEESRDPGECRTATSSSSLIVRPNALGEHIFSLDEAMDFMDHSTETEGDMLSRYLRARFSSNTKAILQKEFGMIHFWIAHAKLYPDLYTVALLIFPVPASSAASQRNFSVVNRIAGDSRSKLCASTIDDLLVVRSTLSNNLDN